MIAVMWTALFGLAVVAVDFGYLYTKKRSLQSVADSVAEGGDAGLQDPGRRPPRKRARGTLPG